MPDGTTQEVNDSRVVSDAIAYVGDASGSATYVDGGTEVDLGDYAKKTWVTGQGYLTEHQDISGKQDTISDLATIRSNASIGAAKPTIYTGTTAPASSLGNNGDLYVQTSS